MTALAALPARMVDASTLNVDASTIQPLVSWPMFAGCLLLFCAACFIAAIYYAKGSGE